MGAPTLNLVGYGVTLSFVVVKDREYDQFVVGLVESPVNIVALAYVASTEHGLSVLSSIFRGFLSLGFTAEPGEIGDTTWLV